MSCNHYIAGTGDFCITCGESKALHSASAFLIQVGGSHYKGWKPEPFKFFYDNNLPYHKADIIKRILRYDQDTGKGMEDLEKIKHEIDMVMELMMEKTSS